MQKWYFFFFAIALTCILLSFLVTTFFANVSVSNANFGKHLFRQNFLLLLSVFSSLGPFLLLAGFGLVYTSQIYFPYNIITPKFESPRQCYPALPPYWSLWCMLSLCDLAPLSSHLHTYFITSVVTLAPYAPNWCLGTLILFPGCLNFIFWLTYWLLGLFAFIICLYICIVVYVYLGGKMSSWGTLLPFDIPIMFHKLCVSIIFNLCLLKLVIHKTRIGTTTSTFLCHHLYSRRVCHSLSFFLFQCLSNFLYTDFPFYPSSEAAHIKAIKISILPNICSILSLQLIQTLRILGKFLPCWSDSEIGPWYSPGLFLTHYPLFVGSSCSSSTKKKPSPGLWTSFLSILSPLAFSSGPMPLHFIWTLYHQAFTSLLTLSYLSNFLFDTSTCHTWCI